MKKWWFHVLRASRRASGLVQYIRCQDRIVEVRSAEQSAAIIMSPIKFQGNCGSKAFSGVSPQFPGVLYCFTSLFRRTPCFPGVPLNLLVFLVFTRFHWSSPLFTGVPYLNHQIFLKLHQVFLKLLIALIAMLDASIVVPAIQ